MLVIAHRGANREAMENSWSAFEKAIEAGASRIELDVQLSKDGHAVVVHDDHLERITGVRRRVSQITRPELARMTLLGGEPLPFLDEVIDRLLDRVELNIEIKGHSTELAQVVANLCGSHPKRDHVIVSCFRREPLLWLAENYPEINRACLWGMDSFTWPFFANMAPQIFLEQCRTNILHPHVSLVDENLMDQAKVRGWKVYGWVEMAGEERDREGLWTAIKTFGIDGLCTNYPRQLTCWLEEASQDEELYRKTIEHGIRDQTDPGSV